MRAGPEPVLEKRYKQFPIAALKIDRALLGRLGSGMDPSLRFGQERLVGGANPVHR